MPKRIKAPEPRYVTIKYGAEYLSISEQSLRRYIAAGRITGYRLGERALRVDRQDLDALLSAIPTASMVEVGR